MPGRIPHEAVRDFIGPFQKALGCVARAKITVSGGGYDDLKGRHYWTINRDQGARLDDGLILHARMNYRIIPVDKPNEEPFRVTTEGYMYTLEKDNKELYAFHWHPVGLSPEKDPHLHVGAAVLAPSAPITPKTHLSTNRISFEQHVKWAIQFGARPLRQKWDEELTMTETVFRLYRSWHGQGDVPAIPA